MKKRFFTTIFALILCVFSAFTVVGCNDQSGGGDINKIYSALDTLYNYDGNYSYTFKMEQSSGSGDNVTTNVREYLTTADLTEGKKYFEYKLNGETISQTKSYVSDDGYTYTVDHSSSSTEWSKKYEYCEDIREDTLAEELSEYDDFFLQIPPAGYSVERLNSAYKAVANISEDLTEQKNATSGNTMTAEYSPKISVNNANGNNVLTLNIVYNEDFATKKDVRTLNLALTENNGKISAYVISFNVKVTNAETQETSVTNIKVSVDINYSFNQTAYDSLDLTHEGNNISQKVWDVYRTRKNLVVNGKPFGSYLVIANGVKGTNGVLDVLIKEFKKSVNADPTTMYFDMAIYLDKDCTKQVDVETITEEDFLSTDTFYMTLALNQETAIDFSRALENKINVNVWDDSVSEDYKIVFKNLLNTDETYSMRVIGNILQKQTLTQNSTYRHYFDGELFTETSFTVSAGQVYTLKTEKIYTENSFNLRSLILG
ncbi:MAG: hypothetical protein IJV95_04070 [Clostridia bacterium]|nr:hypothetical protein [Clostridia bacterium]